MTETVMIELVGGACDGMLVERPATQGPEFHVIKPKRITFNGFGDISMELAFELQTRYSIATARLIYVRDGRIGPCFKTLTPARLRFRFDREE